MGFTSASSGLSFYQQFTVCVVMTAVILSGARHRLQQFKLSANLIRQPAVKIGAQTSRFWPRPSWNIWNALFGYGPCVHVVIPDPR